MNPDTSVCVLPIARLKSVAFPNALRDSSTGSAVHSAPPRSTPSCPSVLRPNIQSFPVTSTTAEWSPPAYTARALVG
eukprot:2049343-Rhodomonas_salina.2